MVRRKYGALLILAVVAGLLGGALSTALLHDAPVIAQETTGQGLKTVTAEEFRLVDQQGRPRALLSFSASGEPSLALLNQEGTRIVWLGLSEESGLAIRDADGKTRIMLSLDHSGETSLILRDRQHKTHSFPP